MLNLLQKNKLFLEGENIFNELTFNFIILWYLNIICQVIANQVIAQMTAWFAE